MENYDEVLSIIIELVMIYDRSWMQISNKNEVVIRNDKGQEIHASTLLSAYTGALALYTGE
jgi:hypothetical protein